MSLISRVQDIRGEALRLPAKRTMCGKLLGLSRAHALTDAAHPRQEQATVNWSLPPMVGGVFLSLAVPTSPLQSSGHGRYPQSMPQLIRHIDEIARDRQEAVLFLGFGDPLTKGAEVAATRLGSAGSAPATQYG